jgi:hypothetical protein
MTRCLVFATENGEQEYVVFTEETDPAGDYCANGYSLSCESTLDGDLPAGFPMGYELHRR